MSKIRISKKLESNGIPANVAGAIRNLGQHYNLHSFTLSQNPADTTLGLRCTAGEGDRYTMIVGDEIRSIEMVTENSLGASGVSHQIGQEFIVPIGGWLITIWYYSGFGMRVENVGFPAVVGRVGA